MTTNHPAHGPVSLDRLHQISEILSKASAQSDGGNLGYAMADAVKVIDGAIAAFGAEPVAYMYKDKLHTDARFSLDTRFGNWSQEDINEYEITEIPLYTAPPAPVVPTFDEWLEIRSNKPLGWVKDAMRESYDACRAAMLQGTDGKPELTVWYGSMPETNGKTNWTAMLHRKGQHPWEGITIDLSEYPDRVRYEADRMRHLIGELADEPDILAYDADAHSGYVKPGNSPVTPDKSTCKYCGGTGYFRWQQSYECMPCPCKGCTEFAAPQQEPPKSDVIGSYQGADGKDHPIVTFSSPQQEVIGIDFASGNDVSAEVVIENGKVISHG